MIQAIQPRTVCLSTAEAAILGYLFPRCCRAGRALRRSQGISLWAGIHYRSDIVAGAALDHAIADKVIDRAQKDGSR